MNYSSYSLSNISNINEIFKHVVEFGQQVNVGILLKRSKTDTFCLLKHRI